MNVTLQDLIYDEKFAGGIRGGHQLKCVIPGGSSVPVLLPRSDSTSRPASTASPRPARCSARPASSSWTRRRAWSGRRRTCCTSTSTSRAASARRAAKAATGCIGCSARSSAAKARCATSICCCRSRTTSWARRSARSATPRRRRCCRPIKTFRAEYEAHIREGRCTVPAPWRVGRSRAAAAH